MKNVRLNKISIILEFVQYHYVAIFSLLRSHFPPHFGSLSKSLLMPQPLALRLRTSTHTLTNSLFIVRVPSFIGIGTQSFFAASNSSSSSPSPPFPFAIEVGVAFTVVAHSIERSNFEFSSRTLSNCCWYRIDR